MRSRQVDVAVVVISHVSVIPTTDLGFGFASQTKRLFILGGAAAVFRGHARFMRASDHGSSASPRTLPVRR